MRLLRLVGAPWLARTFYREFRTVLRKTTIVDVEAINWHALRHTAATQRIHHGVDICSASHRLGTRPGVVHGTGTS